MQLSPDKKSQFKWTASLIILLISFYFLNDRFYTEFTLAVLLFLIPSTLWCIFICFFDFQYTPKKRYLHHRTNSWPLIEKTRELYPTADGCIYLTDSKNNLSGSQSPENETFLIFRNSKENKNISRIWATPFSWMRFKMARNEWTAKKYNKIIIKRYRKIKNCIVIEDYEFSKLKGLPLYSLYLRVALAGVFLNFPLIFLLFASTPFEMYYSNKKVVCELWTFRAIAITPFFLIFGFLIQRYCNKFIFTQKPHNIENITK